MAKSTPANSGGPRIAKLPVSGSSEPIFSGPEPSLALLEHPASNTPDIAIATTAVALLNFFISVLSISVNIDEENSNHRGSTAPIRLSGSLTHPSGVVKPAH